VEVVLRAVGVFMTEPGHSESGWPVGSHQPQRGRALPQHRTTLRWTQRTSKNKQNRTLTRVRPVLDISRHHISGVFPEFTLGLLSGCSAWWLRVSVHTSGPFCSHGARGHQRGVPKVRVEGRAAGIATLGTCRCHDSPRPALLRTSARSGRIGIGRVAGTRARPVLPVGYLPTADAGPPTISLRIWPRTSRTSRDRNPVASIAACTLVCGRAQGWLST
jgi:hypothetical protein